MFLYNWMWPSTAATAEPRLVINAPGPDAKTQQWLDRLGKNAVADRSVFEAYSPHILKNMKAVLIRAEVSEDHPTLKKIEAVLAKQQADIHRKKTIEHTKHGTGLRDEYRKSEDILIENGKIRENLSLEQLKSLIPDRGPEITELDVYDVDDELLGLLIKHCPQITALRIRELNPYIMEGFTDLGLVLIAQLGNIKTLTLDCWNAIYLSHEGFEKLLKSLQGRDVVEEAALIHPYVSDAALSFLGQCKKLKALTLKGGGMLSANGLEKLIQSPLLRASLEKLHLAANYDRKQLFLSDGLLGALSAYSKLKDLSLEGDWQVTDPKVLPFLEALKKLSRVALQGLPISDAMAEKFGKYDQLTSLSLSDCSKVSLEGYLKMLQHKSLLSHLELGKAVVLHNNEGLYQNPFDVISQLPNLTSLSLSGCKRMGNADFAQFCNSWLMRKNLTQLYLSGFKAVESAALGQIGLLESLTTLHIDNCPWFNADAFETLIKGDVSQNLEELHLNKVAITDKSIARLDKLKKLKKLLLGNCYALTEGRYFEGREALFDLEIKKQLTGLALDNYLFSDKTAELIANFTALQVLWVSNNSELTEHGVQTLREIRYKRGNAFNFVVETGKDSHLYKDFAKAFPDEQ